jgi:hypothetical protein
MASVERLADRRRVQASRERRSSGPEVQIDRADWERIEAAAETAGLSPAAWVKAVLLGALDAWEARGR